MNRTEFMSALENRLMPLNEEDREDALRYYDELFDEAGPIDEQKILNELDDPDTIARQILSDNGISPDGRPEFMIDEAVRPQQGGQNANQNTAQNNNGAAPSFFENLKNDFNNMSQSTKIVIIVALILVTSPLWGGVLGTAFGVLMGLIGVAIGLVVTFTAAGVGLTVAGFVYLIKIPPIGLIILGVGLIVIALDILLIFPLVKWAFELLVSLVKWAIDTIKNLVNKSKAQNA